MKRFWSRFSQSRFRFTAIGAVLLVLGSACHGVIAGGPGVPPEADGNLADGLWAQVYTVDWKPVGQGFVAGSPTYQFELTSPPAQECNYIACWPLIAMTWEGYVRVPTEADYTINNYADDGARIWIDGKLALDNWYMGGFFGGNTRSATVHLTAGDHPYYEEYYNANGLEADTFTSIPGTGWVNRGSGRTPHGATDQLSAGFGPSAVVGEYVQDPVNSFTGNLTLQVSDLQLPAHDLPFQLSRTLGRCSSRPEQPSVRIASVVGGGSARPWRRNRCHHAGRRTTRRLNLPALAVLVGGAIAGLAYGVIIAVPLLNMPWHIQARPGRHLSSN